MQKDKSCGYNVIVSMVTQIANFSLAPLVHMPGWR